MPMPIKDPTKRAEYERRRWQTRDKKMFNRQRRERQQRTPEKYRKKRQKWYDDNKIREQNRSAFYYENGGKFKRQEYKIKLFEILGGAKCIKCGFDDIRALQFDHINGGGYVDITTTAKKGVYYYYKRYVENPELARKSLQVLCANCNWIKRVENQEYRKKERIRA